MQENVLHKGVERVERERQAAVTALRAIRDSATHAEAVATATRALRTCGVVPQPKFELLVTELASDPDELLFSLGAGMQHLAAGEAITQQMLIGARALEQPECGRCLSCDLVCDPAERECPRCGEPAIHVGEVTWDDRNAFSLHVMRTEARG